MLLPITPESVEFEEFIEACNQVGLADDDVFQSVKLHGTSVRGILQIGKDSTDQERASVKSSVLAFYAALHELPDRLRKRAVGDSFEWLKLGQLLYESATFSTAQLKMSDDDILQVVLALKMLVKKPVFPEDLREGVIDFTSTALAVLATRGHSDGAEPSVDLVQRASTIARAVYNYL
jgi:hypothetical protein